MAKKKYICEQCGKEFESYFDNAHFCCKSCYFLFKKENSKCRMTTCPVCGRHFLQPRPESIFCSVECRTKSTENRIECVCDRCGKSFERKRSEAEKAQRHYCSAECRKKKDEWNSHDDQLLVDLYRKTPTSQIIPQLHRECDSKAVNRRAIVLGLTQSREWSEDEGAILEEYYSKVPFNTLQEMLPNRSRPSILGKARSSGLLSYFYVSHNYSQKENDFIRENYLSMTNQEIGLVLGRSASAIGQHLADLDLHRPTEINNYKSLYRYIRSRISTWRDRYLYDKNYTCELTGTHGNVVVHHIRGFKLLLMEAVENTGIPLYEDIADYSQEELDSVLEEYMRLQDYYKQTICISTYVHKEFHTLYGYGGNTKEQWNEFVSKYYN